MSPPLSPPRPHKSQMFKDMMVLKKKLTEAEEALEEVKSKRDADISIRYDDETKAKKDREEAQKLLDRTLKAVYDVKRKIEKAVKIQEKLDLFISLLSKDRKIHRQELSEDIKKPPIHEMQKAVRELSIVAGPLEPTPPNYFANAGGKWKVNEDLSDPDKKKIDGPIFFPRVDGGGKQLENEGEPVFDILYFENGKLNPEKSFVAPDDENSKALVSNDLREKIINHHREKLVRSHTKPKESAYADLGAVAHVDLTPPVNGVSNPMYSVGETKYDIGTHIYAEGPLPGIDHTYDLVVEQSKQKRDYDLVADRSPIPHSVESLKRVVAKKRQEALASFDRNSPLPDLSSTGSQNDGSVSSGVSTKATPYAVVDMYTSVMTNVPQNTDEEVANGLQSKDNRLSDTPSAQPKSLFERIKSVWQGALTGVQKLWQKPVSSTIEMTSNPLYDGGARSVGADEVPHIYDTPRNILAPVAKDKMRSNSLYELNPDQQEVDVRTQMPEQQKTLSLQKKSTSTVQQAAQAVVEKISSVVRRKPQKMKIRKFKNYQRPEGTVYGPN